MIPKTYGDDLVAAVSSKVIERFNNHTYRDVVEQVYGMGFTSSDKTSELPKYLRPSEMSFLKRSNCSW